VRDYVHFDVHDFVMDEYFHSWVMNPDEDNGAFWEAWLHEHPEKKREVEEAWRILQQVSFSNYRLPPEDVSRVWKRIKNTDKNHAERISRAWYTAAAILSLLAIVAFVFFWNRNTMLQYRTSYGETRLIRLPDSSTVILNSNSSIKLFSHWNDQQDREIWLEGEAYFSVLHKRNNQRFRVSTAKGVAIEVLGTSFNVNHRKGGTTVVLNSGLIRLSLPTKSTTEQNIIMEPGELVEFTQEKFVKRKVDPQVYSAWTDNKFILDHTSLREMIKMMEENYGVTVEVSDKKLLNETVSGSMPLGDADLLMRQIAQAFRLKLRREGARYILLE
jgi:transmembrane sensor